MKPDPLPDWPTAVPISRERLKHGMTCLSDLPIEQRKRAMQALRTQEPDLANLLTRMGGTFGRLRLWTDNETTKRLGV
jgi:hypothetical protein